MKKKIFRIALEIFMFAILSSGIVYLIKVVQILKTKNNYEIRKNNN